MYSPEVRCLSKCLICDIVHREPKSIHLNENVVFRYVLWQDALYEHRLVGVSSRGQTRAAESQVLHPM